MEALGYVPFWGFSPAINFFSGTDIDINKDDKEINVLLSECADIRHILKSLSDILPLERQREHHINIYIHEKWKENLCRALLFFTIICESNLPIRERQELFFDLFGNSMIRDKSAEYLENI